MTVALRIMIVLLSSVAGVLTVDHLLFTYASLNIWRFVHRIPTPQDLQWWMDHVGPLPAPTAAHLIPPPPSMPGAHAPEWMWRVGLQRNAGAGSDGAPAEPYHDLPMEFLVCAADVGTPLLIGTVMSSPNDYAYRAGVAFPCVAVERSWISPHSVAMPHPTSGGWTWEIKPIGLMVNAIPFAIVIAGTLSFSSMLIRRIRATLRRAHNQCSQCGYRLLKEQSRCPECGSAIKQPSAESSPD